MSLFKLTKKIITTYVSNFPNLQWHKGRCEVFGLDVEYTQKYFARILRWLSFKDTLYTVTIKTRGSQTD